MCLILAGTFSACKKDKDRNPGGKTNCRIVEVKVPGSQDVLITYNSDGKVSKEVEEDSVVDAYTYKEDSIFIVQTVAGRFGSRQVIAVNPHGLATYVRSEYDPQGDLWNAFQFEYNGDQISRSTYTASDGGVTITTYTWLDGNLVASTVNGFTYTYGYYTDKPSQDGDYFSFSQLLSGVETVRNKNLLKSLSGNEVTYSFDGSGKISSLHMSANSSQITTANYTYQCD